MSLSQPEFNRLVSEHGPSLYRLAYRLLGDATEAEDILQETFRSIWDSRQRYDPKLGTRAWMTTILRRRVADFLRRGRRPWLSGDDAVLESSTEDLNPIEQTYTDEMQEALEHLSPDLRETLLLVVVNELTHQEAADVLKVPLGTVLSRVSRARQRLREYFTTLATKQKQ